LKQVLNLIKQMQMDEEELNVAKKVVPPHLNPESN